MAREVRLASGVWTMTVEALRDALEALVEQGHGDDPVVMAYDYGDYSHTQATQAIHGAEELGLVRSAYSLTDLAVANPDDDDEEDARAIVLR